MQKINTIVVLNNHMREMLQLISHWQFLLTAFLPVGNLYNDEKKFTMVD